MRSIPVKKYWEDADKYRAQHGQYADDTFDFISIHNNIGQYSLCAPLWLCPDGKRPLFEHNRFTTKAQAVRFAAGIVRNYLPEKKLKIVECLVFDK